MGNQPDLFRRFPFADQLKLRWLLDRQIGASIWNPFI
jgi:hypothetical protein